MAAYSNSAYMGKKKKKFIDDINEASGLANRLMHEAGMELGDMPTRDIYRKIYKLDKRLPSNPQRTYALDWERYKWEGFLSGKPLD